MSQGHCVETVVVAYSSAFSTWVKVYSSSKWTMSQLYQQANITLF